MTIADKVVYLKEDALGEVARIIQRHSAQRLLFVVDEPAYAACGADVVLEPVLRSCIVARFFGFELNPKIGDIERGVEQSREFDPEMVIALGGGTAIDLGKLIAALSLQNDSPRDIVTGQASIIRNGPPLLAIPTTAGTGSEATHFAVAYVDGEKYSVAHPSMLPDYAVVDPRLTHSLPASVTAATGLDAFCQAIESIWAVGATDESIGYATDAARHALQHLVRATKEPTPEARLGMCQAAHLAGKAINISKTTASHALSYPLTSRHNIPHGVAVAMTLSSMLAYNAQVTADDCVDPRGASRVLRRISMIVELLAVASVAEACRKIEKLVADVGCPISLAEAGVQGEEQLRHIVSSVNAQRMSNNPRQTNPEALLRLLRENAARANRQSRLMPNNDGE
ncbi:MAG: phosphonoacetaldehyde reductase [Planctomycetia bacterium]|nr:phosphonoacetaldehyde reductase [Planctomycetia bacterium]